MRPHCDTCRWLIPWGLAAVLSTPLLPALRAQDEGNLVANPGFEALDDKGRPTGWNLPQPVYSVAADVARSGTHSLKFVNDDPKRYQLSSFPIAFAAGQRYEFEVWIRAEGIQGEDSGATLCMEWYDAQGKYLGGSYPAGVKDTAGNWVKVRGVTGKTPDTTARCSVTCYARRGMTGTAWFDDVAVRPYRAPLLTGLTADRYRATYAGGPAEVFVGLEIPQAGGQAVAVEVTASLLDSAGKPLAAPTLSRPRPELAVVRLDTTPLAPGTYSVRVTATGGEGAYKGEGEVRLQRVAQPVSRRVSIDEYGRVIADGQPFFPLGTYWSGVNEDHLKLYAASPFNCLMPYGGATPEQMDAIARHGLKIIYSIKDYYAGTTWCPKTIQKEADERPAVEKTVTTHRQHPALLAWYLNDELPADMVGRLAAHQQWLEELDPDHPTWVVLYQVDDVRRYLSSFDAIGTDPYPIPQKPASMALDWTRKTHQACFGRRAVWQVPQIFNWAAYRKGAEREACRPPTALEMRSMAWQCIAGGANGLVFYSWFDLWKMKETEPFEQRWAEVTAMAADIRRLFPVLLSVEPVPELKITAPAEVASRTWSLDGTLYLLLVNSGTTKVDVGVTLPAAPASVAAELGAPVHAQDGNSLRVAIEPLEPCVLKLTLKR